MWGLVAPRCVESSWIRDQPRVPCFGKWILIHWTTRDVQMSSFSKALCPNRWGCSWVGKAERKGNVRVPLTALWWASLVAQIINNLPANAEDLGSIPGSGRSPGEGNSNPLLYSCLGNPMHKRSLVGYSSWGCKDPDTAEATKQQQQQLLFDNCLFKTWFFKVS